MLKKTSLKVAAALAFFLVVAGCASTKEEQIGLNISAAMSMKSVLQELKKMYEEQHPDITINLNFAASGALRQQIEQGAPVDVFVSAGNQEMSKLYHKGLVGNPNNVAGNKLVLVVPEELQPPPEDLKQLTAARFRKIAIGAPETVPAGKYGKEALERAGVWAEINRKLVMAKDAQQVLVYVETGNADAGLVYQTDATARAGVRTAFMVTAEYHSPIVYSAAVVTASDQPDRAGGFVRFLQTAKVQAVFRKYGFTPAGTR